MSRGTLQTVTIAAGAALALAARFAKIPWLVWPAIGLLLVGLTLKNMRQWPR
jgi:hypothetical protein